MGIRKQHAGKMRNKPHILLPPSSSSNEQRLPGLVWLFFFSLICVWFQDSHAHRISQLWISSIQVLFPKGGGEGGVVRYMRFGYARMLFVCSRSSRDVYARSLLWHVLRCMVRLLTARGWGEGTDSLTRLFVGELVDYSFLFVFSLYTLYCTYRVLTYARIV